MSGARDVQRIDLESENGIYGEVGKVILVLVEDF